MAILYSKNPSTNRIIWKTEKTPISDLDEIINTASKAQKDYASMTLEDRKNIFLRFSEIVQNEADTIANSIALENGKPFWEAKTEVNSLVSKIKAVFSSYEERIQEVTKELTNGRRSVTRFKPHGVLVVIGPYNFPMSMPNSHIMPALFAGNAVIFKPSEKTPMCACKYAELWERAGLPKGLLQVVYGDDRLGKALVKNNDINGVLFIGSRKAGVSISTALANKTDKICVLEMGGNSPLFVWDYENIRVALNIVIQSAFLSSGQRCSCARRLIVNSSIKETFVPALIEAINNIVIGDAFQTDPVPFMGPVIDQKILKNFFACYDKLKASGAKAILEPKHLTELGDNFVSPGLIDTTGVEVEDIEIFGPLLQVKFVDTFQEGLILADKTEFGLASGIVCTEKEKYDKFLDFITAGIVNWNQPLTGASTVAPFGGAKSSGNHRPAGYFSADYCSHAVASIESENTSTIGKISNGLKF